MSTPQHPPVSGIDYNRLPDVLDRCRRAREAIVSRLGRRAWKRMRTQEEAEQNLLPRPFLKLPPASAAERWHPGPPPPHLRGVEVEAWLLVAEIVERLETARPGDRAMFELGVSNLAHARRIEVEGPRSLEGGFDLWTGYCREAWAVVRLFGATKRDRDRLMKFANGF